MRWAGVTVPGLAPMVQVEKWPLGSQWRVGAFTMARLAYMHPNCRTCGNRTWAKGYLR